MIESLDEEKSFDDRSSYIHAVYCGKDKINLFIKTVKVFGSNESEELLCPFCNAPVYRGKGVSQYVTSHEPPEILGCLKLSDYKTLSLVIQKSCSELEMEGIKAILEQQDFSNIAKKIKSYQSQNLFQASLKKFQINEIISTSSYLKSFSKLLTVKKPLKIKHKIKPPEKGVTISRGKNTPQWILEHSLDSIRKNWTSSQAPTLKLLPDSERLEMRKRWFLTHSMLKGWKTLKRLSKVQSKKENPTRLMFNPLNLHLKDDHCLEPRAANRSKNGIRIKKN